MAHVGVLRVIEAARVPIDVIAGTSAGAIVGALYASGMSAEQIESVARSTTFRRWFALDTTGMGLFSTDGIHRLIDSALGEDVNIEDLPRPFMCVAVDLVSQEEVVFDSGPLADAVCASSAYPGLYAPVRIGNRMLFDGGVVNPVPFDVVRRYGVDRVIAVDLGLLETVFAASIRAESAHGGILWQWFYQASRQKMLQVVGRSLGIMARQLLNSKLQKSPPDIMICPRVEKVGLLDFELREVCFAAGETAARDCYTDLQVLTSSEPELVGWRKALARFKGAIAAQ